MVQETVISSIFKKSPKELKAGKVSKELGYDEPVILDNGYDGRFYGTSNFSRR
jgi:hypothetical protein